MPTLTAIVDPTARNSTPAACKELLRTQNFKAIAENIRQDQQLCDQGQLPSVLAYYLPHSSSPQGKRISEHLFPELRLPGTEGLRALRYQGILDAIKAYLAQMEHRSQGFGDSSEEAEQGDATSESYATGVRTEEDVGNAPMDPISNAIQTLQQLRDGGTLSDEMPLNEVLTTLHNLNRRPRPKGREQNARRCYICRFMAPNPHPLYPSMCEPCGAFNLAELSISLSNNLDLRGKTAMVTGGRVNLGFHTVLRLLRCGAHVIASTRYPYDAEVRYLRESDSEIWRSRLAIVGADFRRAADVFALVSSVKRVLNHWVEGSNADAHLDILVNNAAQTLTDPIPAEKLAIKREQSLHERMDKDTMMVTNGYEPTVRGGSRLLGGLIEPAAPTVSHPTESYSSQKTESMYNNDDNSIIPSSGDDTTALALPPQKSSWVQTLSEIPYEDLISAHSVNTFVPLILIRELLPLMASSSPAPPSHIINVSSREGIFESSPLSSAKAGHHVHTNMSKAALNMITETEAQPAWKEKRVAMNTVDPGYMSAAPEMRDRGDCPMGFEDGAGRVLWSIARAERGEKPMWGRFLKHFGRVEVEVGLGR